MKYKKRLSDLEKRVGTKDLKVSLLKYSLNIQQQEEEVLMQENTDIIVWYFSDNPPKKWIES